MAKPDNALNSTDGDATGGLSQRLVPERPLDDQPPLNTPFDATRKVVRLSVNLNEDIASDLRDGAVRLGISVTEATRRAIGITKVLDAQIAAGREIRAVGPDGSVVQLVFL